MGQLGDVVLSLPALNAIREKFPDANISIMVARTCAEIVRIAGLFDDVIEIDRVGLRRGNKIKSSLKLLKFAFAIRRRRFDLVIDVHSLPETNILGFVSGAKSRLFGNRESRSIDLLSNFRPKPPVEDKSLHISDYYLGTLKPLGINGVRGAYRLVPEQSDVDHVRSVFERLALTGKRLIGIIPGAGHPSRRWPLENFAQMTSRLQLGDGVAAVFFMGPEEDAICDETVERIAPGTAVVRGLNIGQLIAGLSMVSVLVGNDTGPMHIGAATGTPVVLIQNSLSPPRYLPLARRLVTVSEEDVAHIDEARVEEEVKRILQETSQQKAEASTS